jgi:hypothetical protein
MSSLLLSFSPYQVTSALGRSACSKILSKVSSLASNGYLGNSADSLQLLADIVSAFTVLNNVTSSNNSIMQTKYPVNQAVSSTHLPCGFMMERIESTVSAECEEFIKSINCLISPLFLDQWPREGSAARYGFRGVPHPSHHTECPNSSDKHFSHHCWRPGSPYSSNGG